MVATIVELHDGLAAAACLPALGLNQSLERRIVSNAVARMLRMLALGACLELAL